ncbi:hypothetical protein OUZ56_028567 [Daphnia magna]|uniref:Uncharacterized protein n=1 Tax=Daphnia magna TaxID=35525 RepID=A0ABR0B498_9CRUS|nr:hypothetical protein OUZ56_028567 [Daphnia magna]
MKRIFIVLKLYQNGCRSIGLKILTPRSPPVISTQLLINYHPEYTLRVKGRIEKRMPGEAIDSFAISMSFRNLLIATGISQMMNLCIAGFERCSGWKNIAKN